MGINPDRPPCNDQVQAIQRVTYADLPDPNDTPSGTLALVEQTVGPNAAGLYMVRVVAEPNTHDWLFIGPSSGGGGSSLPTLRFVVARTGYGGGTIGDAVPSTTYTNPDPAVAFNAAIAAAAAYRTTLQAFPQLAGLEAQVVIELHPDHYVGQFGIPPGVTVRGLGATPGGTMVDRLDFSFFQSRASAVSNLTLLGDDDGVAMTSSPQDTPGITLESVQCADGTTALLLHSGTLTCIHSVMGTVDWISSGAGVLNSLESQYQKIVTQSVSYRSVGDRLTGIDEDPGPIVNLTSGISIMQNALVNVRNNPLDVTVLLSAGAELIALQCNFLSGASANGSIFDSNPDTFASTLRVRDVTAPGNNVFYGPASRLIVVPLSSHEGATIDEQARTIAAPGFVIVAYASTPDVIEITPTYDSPNTATTFLLVQLPDAARLSPGRRITIKNRSFPGAVGAGGVALATAGQPIDNLASSNAPATVTSSSHVIIAPGSQVTVYVRNDRASFGILSN